MLDDKDEFYAPPKWAEILRRFIEESRQTPVEVVLPGDVIDYDTSGSVTAEQLYEFFGR